MADYVLLYDADCGMCTRFRTIIDRLDAYGNFEFMSIDMAEKTGLLDALPDVLRHRSFHIILPDKQVLSGAEALPTVISVLPSGRFVSKMITSAPMGRELLGFLYSVVARRHEAGLCKLPATATSIHNDLDNLGKRTKTRTRRSPRTTRFGLSVY